MPPIIAQRRLPSNVDHVQITHILRTLPGNIQYLQLYWLDNRGHFSPASTAATKLAAHAKEEECWLATPQKLHGESVGVSWEDDAYGLLAASMQTADCHFMLHPKSAT